MVLFCCLFILCDVIYSIKKIHLLTEAREQESLRSLHFTTLVSSLHSLGLFRRLTEGVERRGGGFGASSSSCFATKSSSSSSSFDMDRLIGTSLMPPRTGNCWKKRAIFLLTQFESLLPCERWLAIASTVVSRMPPQQRQRVTKSQG